MVLQQLPLSFLHVDFTNVFFSSSSSFLFFLCQSVSSILILEWADYNLMSMSKWIPCSIITLFSLSSRMCIMKCREVHVCWLLSTITVHRHGTCLLGYYYLLVHKYFDDKKDNSNFIHEWVEQSMVATNVWQIPLDLQLQLQSVM